MLKTNNRQPQFLINDDKNDLSIIASDYIKQTVENIDPLQSNSAILIIRPFF